MEYGLIGYPLQHSFSKEIHELDLTRATVLRWEVDGDLVIVGVGVC